MKMMKFDWVITMMVYREKSVYDDDDGGGNKTNYDAKLPNYCWILIFLHLMISKNALWSPSKLLELFVSVLWK